MYMDAISLSMQQKTKQQVEHHCVKGKIENGKPKYATPKNSIEYHCVDEPRVNRTPEKMRARHHRAKQPRTRFVFASVSIVRVFQHVDFNGFLAHPVCCSLNFVVVGFCPPGIVRPCLLSPDAMGVPITKPLQTLHTYSV